MIMKCARLAELCTVQRSNLSSRDYEQKRSNSYPYPVIGSGQQPRGYSNTWNAERNSIIISRKGSFGRVSRFDTETLVTDDAYSITNVSPVLDSGFLFHFLHRLVNHKLARNRGKSVLTQERLHNIVIVFPDIEKQKAIAAFFELSGKNPDEFHADFEKLVEPPELSTIRRILGKSNRDIFALLETRGTCRFSFAFVWYAIVLLLVLLCCLNISQQSMIAARDHIMNRKKEEIGQVILKLCVEVSDRLRRSALLYSPSRKKML